MRPLHVELLESRLTPTSTVVGTDGSDAWYILGTGDTTLVLQLKLNGQTAIALQTVTGPGPLTIDAKGGDDYIISSTDRPIIGYLGAGNDSIQVDGAEGGPIEIHGGDGNDIFTGSPYADSFYGDAGNDVLFGAGGADFLDGGSGEDLVIAGKMTGSTTALTLAAYWNNTAKIRSERVADVLKSFVGVNDGAADTVVASAGFDLVFNDLSRSFSVGYELTGASYFASTPTEVQSALATMSAGDVLFLSAGTYSFTSDFGGSLAGKSIVGAGMGQTVIQGANFLINNAGNNTPTLIKGLTIDVTGKYANGVGNVDLSAGRFFLDNVEVTGFTSSQTTLLAFRRTTYGDTQAVVTNSYIHHGRDDLIATGGIASDPALQATSLLELFATTAHTSGLKTNDQAITAHSGFRVVDVGGNYSDSTVHAVAPDSKTRLDLYFTTVTPGARSGNIQMSQANNVIDHATITADNISLTGTLRDSTVTNASATGYSFITAALPSTKIKNNHIIEPYPSSVKYGVFSSTNATEIVDNVFEGWSGDEWRLVGTGPIVQGNTIL